MREGHQQFETADSGKLDALASEAAHLQKHYTDERVKPFDKGRVIIMLGTATGYDGSSVVHVNVFGGESGNEPLVLNAIGCPKSVGSSIKGKCVRILLDTRSAVAYYGGKHV